MACELNSSIKLKFESMKFSKKVFLLFNTFVSLFINVNAQSAGSAYVPVIVVNSDSFPILTLPEVVVVSKRTFASSFEQNKFLSLKKNILIVYPYAKKAGEIFNEVQQELADKDSRRDRKKFLKEKENELDAQFQEPLKNLTTTQGAILVKLIARQTGQNCYELIKEFKNPMSAFFWQSAGSLWGYDLKVPYDPQQDKDIELIVRGIENNF